MLAALGKTSKLFYTRLHNICEMDKKEKKICCICGKEIEGYGYNPYPVREEGQCCRQCNCSRV